MTSTPPREDAQTLTELQTSVRSQLVRVIGALNQLAAEVDAGKVGPKSDASKVLGEIGSWLKIAHEMELRLEKLRQDTNGGGSGYALDLAEARSSIRCRLDRLRRAKCPGCVPG